MTKSEESVFYFARVSIYELNAAKVPVFDKPRRMWARIIECPPLKSTENLIQYIFNAFDDIFDAESEMCILDTVTPVSWSQQPHTVLNSPDADTGIQDITLNASGSGKTGETCSFSTLSASLKKNYALLDDCVNYLYELGVLPRKPYSPKEKQLIVTVSENYFSEFRSSQTFRNLVSECRLDNTKPLPGFSPEYLSGLKDALIKAIEQA